MSIEMSIEMSLEKQCKSSYYTIMTIALLIYLQILNFLLPHMQSEHLKVKTSFGNAPISKNEMEVLITNHVKEYVLTNT